MGRHRKIVVLAGIILFVLLVAAALYIFTPFGFFHVEPEGEYQMKIVVNGHEMTATMENNTSAQALRRMLARGTKTIKMKDYASMEKVGMLWKGLPRNDTDITVEAGDLILYQGNSFVIYYDTNSWNFTRLGKINGVSAGELKDILGDGDVTVKLSLLTEKETVLQEKYPSADAVREMSLSNRVIQVRSGEREAAFQLYDTEAAVKLYEQLPVNLELSNFRDAQWMFYPPKSLPVTEKEIYRDGKKGELSYYAPWGDVFMLYEDFKSGDDMHRLGICISGLDQIAGMGGIAEITKGE